MMLRSEKFHFFSMILTAAFLSQRQERVTAVINAEMREAFTIGREPELVTTFSIA